MIDSHKISIVTAVVTSAVLSSIQPVAADTVDVLATFTASGWMGDARYGPPAVDFNAVWRENPHTPPAAVRVIYALPPRPERWAGIYWQNLPDNWGERPGEDFSGEQFTRVSFWARGETGQEVVEFKAGGINAPGEENRDSFEATSGRIFLTAEWQEYEIPLEGADLSSVIGGFAWIVPMDYNTEPVIFYIDDVVYE